MTAYRVTYRTENHTRVLVEHAHSWHDAVLYTSGRIIVDYGVAWLRDSVVIVENLTPYSYEVIRLPRMSNVFSEGEL